MVYQLLKSPLTSSLKATTFLLLWLRPSFSHHIHVVWVNFMKVKKFYKSIKVTVWSALFEDEIGYYENDDRTTVTVNLECYDHMMLVTDFFLPAIEEYNLENMWFQQDGAAFHITRANMALLQEKFSGREFLVVAISTSHQDREIWHHSTFFLWGYTKDKLSTLEHLKTNIPQVMAEIPPNMC